MNLDFDVLKEIQPFFPLAHIYKNNELILDPKNNIYFRIDNITSKLEFQCKILEWCSRPACKGLKPIWQRFVQGALNGYFRQTWTRNELESIYTRLGNGVNRELCIKFIKGDFDLKILQETTNNEMDKI